MTPILLAAGAALALASSSTAQPPAAGMAATAQDPAARRVPTPRPTPRAAAAVADPARPDADRARDAERKPAQTISFLDIREGQKNLAEFIPGAGYYTRILSKVVGPSGHVYVLPFGEPRAPQARAVVNDPAYSANTTMLEDGRTTADLRLPEKVDVVWTTLNYHDVPPDQRPAMNKAVFEALKPGGYYVIADNSAAKGAVNVGRTLHRIDEEEVKREVRAAGFILIAESQILRNPADPRTGALFSRDTPRPLDHFLLRFRKPVQPSN